MMAGSDTPASNLKTGKHLNASRRNARSQGHAPMTYWVKALNDSRKPRRQRLDPQDIHARLILIIGGTLAATFFLVTVGTVYALIFVTQPIGAQAPNDAAFIDLLKTLAIFLTGSLGGVLAGNGLKPKARDTPKSDRDS
jgi:hypothetical protein